MSSHLPWFMPPKPPTWACEFVHLPLTGAKLLVALASECEPVFSPDRYHKTLVKQEEEERAKVMEKCK